MDFKHTDLPIELKLPKLVRDNIPDLIKQNEGVGPKIRIAKDDKEFLGFALKKVIEESVEVFEAKLDRTELIKEIADLFEIISIVTKTLKITPKEIDEIQTAKRIKNGGFEKRIILE